MTSYYHLPTDTPRSPRRLEAKLSDGRLVGPPDTGWTPELAALCGFIQVTETDAPAVSNAQVTESTVELVNGTPTRVWSIRAKTQDELDNDTKAANRATLTAKAATALTTNADFLALASPTNAQILAQVKALTKENTVIIKLLLVPESLGNISETWQFRSLR